MNVNLVLVVVLPAAAAAALIAAPRPPRPAKTTLPPSSSTAPPAPAEEVPTIDDVESRDVEATRIASPAEADLVPTESTTPGLTKQMSMVELEEQVAASRSPRALAGAAPLPKFDEIEDEEFDPTRLGDEAALAKSVVERIVVDAAAASDEATSPRTLFLVVATAETDTGLRRKRNEDSLLVMNDADLFVVADGMGGHRGGAVASKLVVQTMAKAFEESHFEGAAHENLPIRASELARSVQMANVAVLRAARADPSLGGMGSTVCAARFARNKQRLYVAHVGDSRLYRLRRGELTLLTADHTMAQLGAEGATAGQLSRAVGVWPTVAVDVLLAEPQVGDAYLLCTDGLVKMVPGETIAEMLTSDAEPKVIVDSLIAKANELGGRDNVTVILVRVCANPENEPTA